MTNAFAFPCQKILKKHSDDEEIALILKDIENAKQGVMTFSKEVKKYMLQFIHARDVLFCRYLRSGRRVLFLVRILARIRRVESDRQNVRIQGRGRSAHRACQTRQT